MNEIINVNYDNERPTVSARELYGFLDITERFSNWFERMGQYLIADEDFTSVKNFTLVNNGASRELQDYQLTVEAAKEIAMLQRNDKGKQARQYFIQLEKDWNSPEKVMARALQIADRKIHSLTEQINQDKPKVLFADSVSASKTSILVGELAKLLRQNGINIGQNRLFDRLRADGYLIKRRGNDWNMPTQYSMDLGLFEIKEHSHLDSSGNNVTTKTAKVTGKGQIYFINKYLAG